MERTGLRFAYHLRRGYVLLLILGTRSERARLLLLLDRLEVRADYGFIGTLDKEIRRDPEREVGYRITDTWDEMLEDMPGAPVTDETELGRRMTNFVTTRDRRAHAHTALIMEREARLSCEAWGRSRDASDLTRSEVMALRTQVTALQGQLGPASGPTWPEILEEAGSSS
ncbi:hypothetical protein Tco_0677418 [Tanacetum coccineum]|uniref:Uncharacterized protein n=1 Tax=Tanacetum coccineum TaxID=301880 RepID=A0ABQ4XC49_9ASTR